MGTSLPARCARAGGEVSVTESKPTLDLNDPFRYAPPRVKERSSVMSPGNNDPLSMPHMSPQDRSLQVRPPPGAGGSGGRTQSDMFAEAVAQMMREQREAKRGETPSMLLRRPSLL